jgi:hypothetical protein
VQQSLLHRAHAQLPPVFSLLLVWAGFGFRLFSFLAQTGDYQAKLEASLKKSLDEFDEVCWRVNHASEPLPSRRGSGGGAAAAAAGSAAAAGGVAAAGDGDDDVVTVGSGELTAVDLLDPFTKTALVDPVRARQCGHRFSRDSVTQFLLRRFRASGAPGAASGALDPAFEAPCQAAGCSKRISLDTLLPDTNAVRALARIAAEEKRRARDLADSAGGAAAAAAAASDARVAAAAQAAAKRAREAAKRKRGTVKQEAAGAEDDEDEAMMAGAVNDLTQQPDGDEEDEAAKPRRSSSRKA